MFKKIKQFIAARKCTKRGHHWFCERTLDNDMICTTFYKWVCLTCDKSAITELRYWDLVEIKNPQDVLDLALPKEK